MQVLQQLLEIKRKDMEAARKQRERAERAEYEIIRQKAHASADVLPELSDDLTFGGLAEFAREHNEKLAEILDILFQHGLKKNTKVSSGRNELAMSVSGIEDDILHRDNGAFQYTNIITTVLNLTKWIRSAEYEKNAPNQK